MAAREEAWNRMFYEGWGQRGDRAATFPVPIVGNAHDRFVDNFASSRQEAEPLPEPWKLPETPLAFAVAAIRAYGGKPATAFKQYLTKRGCPDGQLKAMVRRVGKSYSQNQKIRNRSKKGAFPPGSTKISKPGSLKPTKQRP